ncbi:MAG TPA: preprotein translocase subunit SecG [Rhodanobacteraceae bacterium]|nr:preprotein translocase subunit SecG [Rhodanobacteraceae bacterium]
MIFTIFSVFNILVAAAMIILILMQRGEGAGAGAGFGGGASATVFGARGSASFLSRATSGLAAVFFVLSLLMGIYLSQNMQKGPDRSLGVMAGAAAVSTPATATTAAAVPPAVVVPQVGTSTTAAPAAAVPQPQPATTSGGVDGVRPPTGK